MKRKIVWFEEGRRENFHMETKAEVNAGGYFPASMTPLYYLKFGDLKTTLLQNREGYLFVSENVSGQVSNLRDYAFDEMREAIGVVTDVARSGDILCLATKESIYYLRIDDDSFIWLGKAPEAPLVEFALSHSAVPGYSLTADALPSCSFTLSSGERLDEKVRDILENYMKSISDESLFAEPFLVYAALRYADGVAGPPSPLVLMLPATDAPWLRVLGDSETEGVRTVSVQILSRPCRLMMRLRDAPVERWKAFGATHLDIYCSRGVALYDAAHITSGASRRSIPSLSHSGATRAVDGGYEFVNHYEQRLVSADSVPLCFEVGGRSQSAICRDLCSADGFYRVASVGLDSFAGRSEAKAQAFMMPEILAGSPLTSHDDADGITVYHPDYKLTHEVGCKALAEVAQGVVALSPVENYPRPWPLSNLGAYFKKDGVEQQSLPRWIWHGVDKAFGITLYDLFGRGHSLPMTNHDVLSGSYYFDGLGERSDTFRPSGAQPEANVVPETFRNYIFSSLRGCVFEFPGDSRNVCGQGETLAMAGSLRALSSGQLGEFPQYCFTTEGIWALRADNSGGFMPVQEISRDIVATNRSVAALPSSALYIGGSGIYTLRGTVVEKIDVFGKVSDTGIVAYNRHADVVMLLTGDSLYVSDSEMKKWEPADMGADVGNGLRVVKATLDGVGDTMLFLGGRIYEWSRESIPGVDVEGVDFMSDPILLEAGRRVRSVRILGCRQTEGSRMTVWGSCDLVNWVKVYESGYTRVAPCFGPAWRWVRVAVKSDDTPLGVELVLK